MPCDYPLKGFRLPSGGITFEEGTAHITPMRVPCGQCAGCRLERSRQWAVRIQHEASQHETNSFITLTYNKTHLPENGGLVLKHWQDFAKRLRKKVGPFRFYQCGEYGDVNDRPHHHSCIFGQDFRADRKPHKITDAGNQLYVSDTLDQTWGKGHCYIGELTFESAAYVARYCLKKVTGSRAESHYYGRKPEFATMSLKPGIGAAWIEKYTSDVYPSDEVIVNGKPSKPPRYYDAYLEKTNPTALQTVKDERRARALKHTADQTPERLSVRATVRAARMSAYRRDL